MSRQLIHLVCGSTCSGKTTYALQLADELGAIQFSIDEWMTTLFWMDTPQPLDPSWSLARVERCNEMIWRTVAQVAARGIPCVLDLGFSTAQQRSCTIQRARKAGLFAQIHYLDVSPGERWRRVQARNRDKGDTNQLPFEVSREMFEFVETLFEVPSDDEMRAAHGIRIPQ